MELQGTRRPALDCAHVQETSDSPMPRHPVIALWCHPRSMSTAVERIMRARGDCRCFHEPFMYDYYINRAVRLFPNFEPEDDKPRTYEDIRAAIMGAADEGPVFFKDMSYYMVPRLYDDPEFAAATTNVFLIRDPRKAIVSYHRLDQDVTAVEIGLEAQWQHYAWLVNALAADPLVIEAEALQAEPGAAVARFFDHIGLEQREQALAWESMSKDDLPEEWKSVSGWHGDVTSATGLRPPEDEADVEAKFEAAANKTPKLRRFLDQHQPYYDLLRERALQRVNQNNG